jgi:hypothetical protein
MRGVLRAGRWATRSKDGERSAVVAGNFFGREPGRQTSSATLIFEINLLNAPASNVKNEGIPLAQVSVRRDGDL